MVWYGMVWYSAVQYSIVFMQGGYSGPAPQILAAGWLDSPASRVCFAVALLLPYLQGNRRWRKESEAEGHSTRDGGKRFSPVQSSPVRSSRVQSGLAISFSNDGSTGSQSVQAPHSSAQLSSAQGQARQARQASRQADRAGRQGPGRINLFFMLV